MSTEVRAKVPPRTTRIPYTVLTWDSWQAKAALEAAADTLHVYRLAGPWDGGVQLRQAMAKLDETLEPLLEDKP